MPKKKNLNDYLTEFYRDVLSAKYEPKTVTPEIYRKELLDFIKKMDPDFALNNIVEFINQSAHDTVSLENSNYQRIVKDKSIMPYQYFGNLLKNNRPSKEIYEAINSNMNKDAYISFCDTIRTFNGVENENAKLSYKINKFKMIEALKPTGNKVTKFFKKLFNIGGYKDKLEAYDRCKEALRQEVGDKLSNDEFEKAITGEKDFIMASTNTATKININKEFDNERIEKPVKDVNVNEPELVNNMVK